MGYGYCTHCRAFHAANEDIDPDLFTPPLTKGGGFMRCCVTSLRAWAVYHPAPWPAGTGVQCLFTDDTAHLMQFCACGYWHWARAMCAQSAPETTTS